LLGNSGSSGIQGRFGNKRHVHTGKCIEKWSIEKDILESGAYIVATKTIKMERTYSLEYAIRKRLVCKDILESGTYSGNNNN
jgi:hypothetical protein